MADTARTIAFLQSSIFQDGQPSGSITPQDMRDYVLTAAYRSGDTYGTYVRVTDPEFGADPTGTVDSTAAFQNAMAKGPTLVPALQPNGSRAIFRLSNCIVPNGSTLIGEVGGPPYIGGGGVYKGFGSGGGGIMVPAMIAPLSSSTTRIFNLDNKAGITFKSLLVDCSNVTGFVAGQATQVCDAFAGYQQNINYDSVSVYYAHNGIGGLVSGGSTNRYGWIVQIRNCVLGQCVNGIIDMIDAHITDSWFTTCQNGIQWGDNSSSNTVVNTRIEWCGQSTASGGPWTTGGNGANLSGSAHNQFVGCWFDANGISAINFNNNNTWSNNGSASGAFMNAVTGCYFQCNGTNVTTLGGTTLVAASCHINIENAYNTNIVGNTSRGDVTRILSVYAPVAWIHFAGANGGLMMIGNDMTGYQGSTAGATKTAPQNSPTLWRTGTDPANAWVGTASIAAATMTVTATTSGALAIGQNIAGAQVIPGSRITAGSGTTWTVTPSQTVASTTMLAYLGGQGANSMVIKNNYGTGAAGCDIDSR